MITLPLRLYRGMIKKNEELLEVFTERRMAGLRQPKNLRRTICSSKLFPVSRTDRPKRQTHSDAPGWRKSGKPCPVCPYTLQPWSEVVGQITRNTHTIQEAVDIAVLRIVFTVGKVTSTIVWTTPDVSKLGWPRGLFNCISQNTEITTNEMWQVNHPKSTSRRLAQWKKLYQTTLFYWRPENLL